MTFYFNPRSRKGNDPVSPLLHHRHSYFNPRSRKGNDLPALLRFLSLLHFNPRSRKGNDNATSPMAANKKNFNPRSRKGNDISRVSSFLSFSDFNPRSRKGNDYRFAYSNSTIKISIHVPARGTTASALDFPISARFQSTFPQGERRFRFLFCLRKSKFQSTFPQGERLLTHPASSSYGLFQSTFPQGERPPHGKPFIPNGHFNPRSRKGNDACINSHCRTHRLFQSTFPQGERLRQMVQFISTMAFQSTFPQGERQGSDFFNSLLPYFNPRSRKGNDAFKLNTFFNRCNFNPRSRKGNDKDLSFSAHFYLISIHVPARGTTCS